MKAKERGEDRREAVFFLFVLARCACGYELIDYWTSDLIELEIPGESLRGRDLKSPGKPRAGNEQANSGSVPSAVNFFPLLFAPPHLGGSLRGCPGFSAHPGVVSEESSGPGAGRAPRRGCAGRGLESTCRVGTCLPDPQPRLHPGAPAPAGGAGLQVTTPAGGSSLWRVPQGSRLPRGFANRKRKSKGWSLPLIRFTL